MIKRTHLAPALTVLLALAGAGLAPACGSSQAHESPRQAVVWAEGDGADGGRNARSLAEGIAEDRPDRFLYLGDVYPHGSASDFARNYAPVYGRWGHITEPTPGNHGAWRARAAFLAGDRVV